MQNCGFSRRKKNAEIPKRLLVCAWKFFVSENFGLNSAFAVLHFQKLVANANHLCGY
jgi:hypothetical protein